MNRVLWNYLYSKNISAYLYIPLLIPFIVNLSYLINGALWIFSSNMLESSQSRLPHLVHHRIHSHFVMNSFIPILPLIAYSHIHLNILTSMTFVFLNCRYLTDQHSTPYNMTDTITILYNIPSKFDGTSYHIRHWMRTSISPIIFQYDV